MSNEQEILDEHHNAIVNGALDEVQNQIDKWGVQHHPDGTGSESDKRLADVAKALTDNAAKHGGLTWKLILDEEVKEAFAESNAVSLRAELEQVAAVAISWIRDLDNRPKEGAPREPHYRTYGRAGGVSEVYIAADGTANLTEELLHDLMIRAGFEELA